MLMSDMARCGTAMGAIAATLCISMMVATVRLSASLSSRLGGLSPEL